VTTTQGLLALFCSDRSPFERGLGAIRPQTFARFMRPFWPAGTEPASGQLSAACDLSFPPPRAKPWKGLVATSVSRGESTGGQVAIAFLPTTPYLAILSEGAEAALTQPGRSRHRIFLGGPNHFD